MNDVVLYESKIRASLDKAKKSIVQMNNANLQAGKDLLQAKETLSRIEFQQLLARLELETTKAERLMKIAGDRRIREHWDLLVHVDGETLLYRYALMEDDDFKSAIVYTQGVGPENASRPKLEDFYTTKKTRNTKSAQNFKASTTNTSPPVASPTTDTNAPVVLLAIYKVEEFTTDDWRDAELMAQSWEQRFGTKAKVERMPALQDASSKLFDVSSSEGVARLPLPGSHLSQRM